MTFQISTSLNKSIYLSLYSRALGPLAEACLIKLNNFWSSLTNSDTLTRIYLNALFYPSNFSGYYWIWTSIKVSSSCLWISVTRSTRDLLFRSWIYFYLSNRLSLSDRLLKLLFNCLLDWICVAILALDPFYFLGQTSITPHSRQQCFDWKGPRKSGGFSHYACG